MAKKNNTEVENTAENVVETPKLDIIRGRLLLPIVYAIKFLDSGTDAELAARYRTTGGKISDIKGNRNFGYITEDTRFPADDINDAVIFAEQLGEGEETVKGLLNQMTPGNDSDVASLKAARAAARKSKKETVEAPVEETAEAPAE